MNPGSVSNSSALLNSRLTQSTTTIASKAPPLRRDQSAAGKLAAPPTVAELKNLADHIRMVGLELKPPRFTRPDISTLDVALLVQLDRAVQLRKNSISAVASSREPSNFRKALIGITPYLINLNAHNAKFKFVRASYQLMDARSALSNTPIKEDGRAPSNHVRRPGDQFTSNLEIARKRLESARGEIHNMLIQLEPKN